METNNKVEIVKDLILKTFFFLEKDFNYKPIINSSETKLFIESITIQYSNEILRRKIKISYTQSKVYNDVKHTFHASITRLPSFGPEDIYSLYDHLESLGKNFPISLVNHFDNAEAEMILNKIADALKVYSFKIISGDEWLEKYYPKKD